MFERVGNRLIIDFNNCENKKEKNRSNAGSYKS